MSTTHDQARDKLQSQSRSYNNVEPTKPFVSMELDETQSIVEVKTHQCWSILNIFCCNLLLGIVAFVYSTKTRIFKKQGKLHDALIFSKEARRWNIVATILGMVFISICVIRLLKIFLILIR